MDEVLLGLCRTLPGASEEVKWRDHLVFSVGGKMFAIFDAAGSEGFRLRTDPAVFPILTRHAGVVPAPNLGHHSWVKLESARVLDRPTLEDLVTDAHRLAAEKLSRKARAALGIP